MSKKAPKIKYKLTKEDKEWLTEHRFSDDDIFEISYAITKTTYKDEYGFDLSIDEVIRRMGRFGVRLSPNRSFRPKSGRTR